MHIQLLQTQSTVKAIVLYQIYPMISFSILLCTKIYDHFLQDPSNWETESFFTYKYLGTGTKGKIQSFQI